MINPVYFNIAHADGSKRTVIIEPVLEKVGDELKDTRRYKLYKSSIDNESSLFTEKLEMGKTNDDLPDEKNPDFLGELSLSPSGQWQYKGDLLSPAEQQSVAHYIGKQN